MIATIVKQRLFIFISLLLHPLSVFAHGGELNFLGPQLMQYFALLLLTIFLATPGNRWMSFFVVLLIYPVVFILVAIMILNTAFPNPDQALVYVMYAVSGLTVMLLIVLRLLHKPKIEANKYEVS